MKRGRIWVIGIEQDNGAQNFVEQVYKVRRNWSLRAISKRSKKAVVEKEDYDESEDFPEREGETLVDAVGGRARVEKMGLCT
mmetsp:Transcript_21074/g.51564  ORF Transcript_21074/g.51564 Transcript_21074/m.51564 type:complete len:82 (-) Transcript_21074:276-521(-)